jgi:hypothetical protein
MKSACAMLFALLGALATSATAEETTKSLPARIELAPFETLTLSDSAFLKGDREAGKPTTLAGEFRIAQGQGRLPLVILLHGSGGLNGTNEVID